MSAEAERTRPWETILVDQKGRGSLVSVAREGRLSRYLSGVYVRVGLHLVDESVLALVDWALFNRCNVTFVYPSPAGEVSALLAAQILITRLLQGRTSPSVGIVTADATSVARTWNQLAFGGTSGRAAISDVFPCVRTGPNGEYPRTRRSFKGLLVGRQFVDWPVDVVIRDHLAGPAPGEPKMPTISIHADPLEPSLNRVSELSEPIWGWAQGEVAMLCSIHSESGDRHSPFSVSSDRLSTIASGIRTTIHVARNSEAEHSSNMLKDDLMTISQMAGDNPPAQLLRGLRVAWNHQRTLQALPVRPSQFDRFSGTPPIAAISTDTYEPELRAWARAIGGEIGELAEIVAGDMADLRGALEAAPPFITELSRFVADTEGALLIVRNGTAARALVDELGGDITRGTIGDCRVVSMRTLHRTGRWDRAFVVGMPPRWDWHRLDSGITSDLHLLVLGEREASSSRRSLRTLHEGRRRWSTTDMRTRAWERLVRRPPPPNPSIPASTLSEPEIVGAFDFVAEPDPFEPFESLLVGTPLFSEEGPGSTLAQEGDDGLWVTEVEAVGVVTDVGVIRLPTNRIVDIRRGTTLTEVRADRLTPGVFLIINRRGGNAGLLNAVAERLRTYRPDLYVANLVIRDLRSVIRERFQRSRYSYADLYRRLNELGFDKSYQAARGYVQENGPIAPRDFADLKRLSDALELGYDDRRLREVFAAVQRERNFRRATGRALAGAARRTTVVSDDDVIDDETGLSLADLQELVLEALVLEVNPCESPVPLSETGVLSTE